MKPSQHTTEQIIKILEQADKGEQTVGALCREHGISEATFYRWRRAYGGMSLSEAQRLKELEKGGILERRAYSEIPPRVEYRLTGKGQELVESVMYLLQWMKKWSK